MKHIDFNADLGEGGPSDAELLQLVSSANICCGAHAGDQQSIRGALREAARYGVAIGAHPSYPDREQFGRRNLQLSERDLRKTIHSQLDYLAQEAEQENARFHHVKPHGALYNQAASDPQLAQTLISILQEYDPDLVLVALAGSELEHAGRQAGMQVRAEAFADRRYDSSGRLLPRSRPDAVLHDSREAIEQSLELITAGRVRSADGHWLEIRADTLCLHGDNPEALAFARLLRQAFETEGIRIQAH